MISVASPAIPIFGYVSRLGVDRSTHCLVYAHRQHTATYSCCYAIVNHHIAPNANRESKTEHNPDTTLHDTTVLLLGGLF